MSSTRQKRTVVPLRPASEVYMILRDRKKLARLMIVQEVSQRELAEAAGWRSHSYLGRLLRGEAKTLDTTPALRIAHHLMVPVDDLFQVRMDSKPVRRGLEMKAKGDAA
ncbi:helix-turn-helix DNA binding domain protein [Gordonia phage LitninMcQueen]